MLDWHCVSVIEPADDRIRNLIGVMNRLEIQIAEEVESIKDQYSKAAAAMPEDKSYFLNGVQAGSVVKSYLLTRRGIEVPGEKTVQIPEFIDNVIRFANYPKRKIEVLSDLSKHLQNVYALIGTQEAQ
ncbi:MAG: hypothetical protein AB1351_13460 [Thermoproteota archaeon]